MKLLEKFHKWLRTEPFGSKEEPTLREAQCVVIADEFAIGFAEWFADNTLRVDLDGYKTFGDTDETKPHTIKELLEIYKKEKGF
jgi:hypothetical protein